ncbi:aldo/keto reductase [Streptomyces lydicus]
MRYLKLRDLEVSRIGLGAMGMSHGYTDSGTDEAESVRTLHRALRFTGENFQRNLRLADEVQAVAADADATPAQVAPAWLLAQGDDIAPIPGTKRVHRVEENTAADDIQLTAEQIDRLSSLPPAAGETHTEAGRQLLER